MGRESRGFGRAGSRNRHKPVIIPIRWRPILSRVTCLECGKVLPDDFFEAWQKSPEAKSGRFTCPGCGADHVRREIGRTPEGKPLFNVRLWGHPTTRKRKREDRGSR